LISQWGEGTGALPESSDRLEDIPGGGRPGPLSFDRGSMTSIRGCSARSRRDWSGLSRGRVVAVAGHPTRDDLLLRRCAGGVWKTTDGGTYWENVSDGFFDVSAVGAIAVAAWMAT